MSGPVVSAGGAGTAAAIEVVELAKAYQGRPVLRGVSLNVRSGEILALLGPNGAGKTTTVEMIEGYRTPDGGRVRVLGVDPAQAGRRHRARVGLMLQGGGGIDPRMTAREVVTLYARFHADPHDPAELLSSVGLGGAAGRTRYRRLSGGEKQRVGLAVALVGRPEVAILDEPTAGMDVEARSATRNVLAAFRAAGGTVLLTSHDLADVERLADRIAILDRGRIVALGTPDELMSESSGGLRFRVSATGSTADVAELAEALARSVGGSRSIGVERDGDGSRYRVVGAATTPAMIQGLASWCASRGLLVEELRSTSGTLEERYLELTGSAAGDDDGRTVADRAE